MSALSTTSPRAWAMSLPISSVIGRANSSVRARIMAAAFVTTAGRPAKVVCRQFSKQVAAFPSAVSSCVGEFLERFQNLAVIGVDALVSHRVGPLLNPTLLVTLAGIAHTQTPGMKIRGPSHLPANFFAIWVT